MKKANSIVIVLAIITFPFITAAQTYKDLTTILMRSTFKIEGPSATPGKNSIGTIFLIANPTSDMNLSQAVLVTANHVLDEIKSDSATVYLIQKQTDGTFMKLPHTLQIRNKGLNLWTKHPVADIATMMFPLPPAFKNTIDGVIPSTFLARDADIQKEDLQPGEELNCLGFPFGIESNSAGFSILRSGKIASFPVYPSKIAPQILLDIRIFGGNSGGPVFFDFVNRRRFGTGLSVNEWRGIAGVLIQDISYEQTSEGYFGSSTRRDPIGIAVVAPAQFVVETIEIMNHQEK
jgi:hypothetical protein